MHLFCILTRVFGDEGSTGLLSSCSTSQRIHAETDRSIAVVVALDLGKELGRETNRERYTG
jgi:hypothetical protein